MVYKIFISHSWSYSDAYERLICLLENAQDFEFLDYSVPKDDPIHYAETDEELELAIEEQIRPVRCVIIPAGVYATYSKWINIEIDIAKRLGKSIIAVKPWGSKHTSEVVKKNADMIVNWNTSSIVDAIQRLSKHSFWDRFFRI